MHPPKAARPPVTRCARAACGAGVIRVVVFFVVFGVVALASTSVRASAQAGPPIPVAGPPIVQVGDGPTTTVDATAVPSTPTVPASASITSPSAPTTAPTVGPTVMPTVMPTTSPAPTSLPGSRAAAKATSMPATTVAELRAQITTALTDARTVSIGVFVTVDGGAALFEREPDVPRIPASTQKLYVAAVALNRLGADHRFVTDVRSTASVGVGGVLAGDLVLRASGDPSFGTAQLRSLADGIVRSGVRRVDGGLVVDDSRFDATTRVDSWKAAFSPGEVGLLDAFSVDGNHRPAADAGLANLELFRAALTAKGVTVAGISSRGSSPTGPVLASVESAPLRDIVGHMLKKSDNTYAELLVKELGATAGPGSTSSGVRAIAAEFARLGVAAPQQIDGSGLSALNRSTPRQQVQWLQRTSGSGADLRASLSGACVDGTLRSRMCRSAAAANVIAKSGAIDNVVGLAGYATTASGRKVTFSFLLNDVRSSARARAAIDHAMIAVTTAVV